MYDVGDYIELVQEMDGEIFNGEYRGIPVGDKGIIQKIAILNGNQILEVNWESGRSLSVIIPIDKVKILNKKTK